MGTAFVLHWLYFRNRWLVCRHIFLTHDGGRTWEQTGNVNEEWSRVLTAAAFANASMGYLCFRYDIENIGRVYQTGDGRQTWSRLEIPNLAALAGNGVGEVRSLTFDKNGHGKMVFYFRNENNKADEGEVVTLFSKDKGQTWMSINRDRSKCGHLVARQNIN